MKLLTNFKLLCAFFFYTKDTKNMSLWKYVELKTGISIDATRIPDSPSPPRPRRSPGNFGAGNFYIFVGDPRWPPPCPKIKQITFLIYTSSIRVQLQQIKNKPITTPFHHHLILQHLHFLNPCGEEHKLWFIFCWRSLMSSRFFWAFLWIFFI